MEYTFTGNIKSYTQIRDGIEFLLEEGKLRLHILSDDIVRVRFTQNEAFENDFSYAVCKTEWAADFKMTEKADYFLFSTSKINIKVNKSPLRISFLDHANSIISSDENSFGIGWMGTEVAAFKKLEPFEKFFGLGEKVGNLDKRGKFFRMWNTDFAAYGHRQDPLYISVPFFIGLRNNKAYGYFLDNTNETFFNLGASQERYYSFGAKFGELNYYFFYGPEVSKVVELYTELTGRMPLPPLWGLGYQQCRWSYFPDSNVMNIVRNFRNKKIPLDVIYLDIDWMDDFRVFKWHPHNFPEPAKLIKEIEKEGVKVVTIIDPGIKADDSYFVAKSGLEGNHFVKYPDGQVYKGEVWPGWSYFPDFTNQKTRDWWSGLFKDMTDVGVRGFWNDMNEPAVWGQAFPDMIRFNYEGMHKNHKASRNIYGMQMARATYEGAKKYLNGERPLIVTRAGYSGVQRYSSVWTGDNESNEGHYRLNCVMVQGLGLSGISFAGPDIGGFDGEPTKELFARWIQLGVFTPFFRTHSARNTKSQEPWTFGEDVENNVREMIKKRYMLLPYLYTAMYHSHIKGIPVVKPLFWFNQSDEMAYQEGFQYQYYFGNDIMVVAAKVHQDFTKVYLPEGDWFEFDTGEKYHGKQVIIAESPWTRLPVFVKAGSMIPMRESQLYAEQNTFEKVFLHVYPGENNICDFYEDDGHTFEYLKGSYLLRKLSLSHHDSEIELRINHSEGKYSSTIKEWNFIIYNLKHIKGMEINGITHESYSFDVNRLIFSTPEDKLIKINIVVD